MIVTLSNATSPHNKGMLSLNIGLAGAYSWGLSHLPDCHADIGYPEPLIACLF